MEIDFHKFENYLIKKDKKNPDYRPLTSLPYNRPRNMSALESIQNQQLPRKSPQIGYTLRMHPNERRTKNHWRSDSMHDSIFFEDKTIKLKMTNDLGMKNLLLRRYDAGKSSGKLHLKEMLGERLATNICEDQNKNLKQMYQRKKLRVVKGKANSYKLKMKTMGGSDTITRGQESGMDVSIVGTRIL